MSRPDFAAKLLAWHRRCGRRDLPWQHPRSAYRVWVAEVMLQQTQVATVIPYFRRFVRRFPGFAALARAPLGEVLAAWSGLGYYARARHLHRAAQRIVAEHGGRFPRRFDQAAALPGLGRSSAAAVLAQAFGQRHAILDGNVKRVLARCFAVPGWPGEKAVAERLWALAESLLPEHDLPDYTQAIMDLGALVCRRRRPRCEACPLAGDCRARAAGRVEDFPAPRPRRAKAERRLQMLLVCDPERGVLLRRRPPDGLWGGLLGPPELDAADDPHPWLRRHLGRVAPLADWPTLRHELTHLRLHIRPRVYRLLGDGPAGDDWVWYDPAGAAGPLAAPVARLVARLKREVLQVDARSTEEPA